MKDKGLRKTLESWNRVHPQKDLSVQEIYDYLLGIFKERAGTPRDLSWKHYTWEEDGEQYSMWCSGGTCMGDKGYEMMLEELSKLNYGVDTVN